MKMQDEYLVKQVKKPHQIITGVPGSKSITNRALLIAAMAEGTSVLKGVLFSDDSRYFIQALIDMEFPVSVDEAACQVTVTGFGGKIPYLMNHPGEELSVYVGSAGTAARFLTAFFGLSEGQFYLNSSEQMKKRPMQELVESLESLGAEFTFEESDGHFPFHVHADGCRKEETVIDVDKSSQFLSALLITSVLLDHDFTIRVKGTHGMAYVEMTIAMMEQFGVKVEKQKDHAYRIRKEASYTAREYQIEPDLSAACYFYAMSPLLLVPAKVLHVKKECLQGDIAFLSVLSDMGCRIREDADGICVFPPQKALSGGSWDLSGFSDQALTLAALAPFADSPVTINGIGHIRMQECDRIHAIAENLSAMGIRCEEQADSVTIYPGIPKAARIKTYDDHRVAMAFAIDGLVTEGIRIENPSCCKKTFENYFEVLEEQVYEKKTEKNA